jgi:hypothetical protein
VITPILPVGHVVSGFCQPALTIERTVAWNRRSSRIACGAKRFGYFSKTGPTPSPP